MTKNEDYQKWKKKRIEEENSSIIDAAIMMMLIDKRIDQKELNSINELYFYLYGKNITHEEMNKRVLELSEKVSMEPVGDVAKIIVESMGKRHHSNSRIIATEALMEVMYADDIEHSLERELVEIISKIWGTEEIVQDFSK